MNYLNLWKPTIDALGPILGSDSSGREWSPDDGRITELGMHVTADSKSPYGVKIGKRPDPRRLKQVGTQLDRRDKRRDDSSAVHISTISGSSSIAARMANALVSSAWISRFTLSFEP